MNLRRRSQKVVEGAAPKPKTKTDKSSKNLNNKFVCITGTITGMTRGAAQLELRKKFPSVRIQNNVTSTTDYLITGYGVGQKKLQLAARWGVTTVDATEIF